MVLDSQTQTISLIRQDQRGTQLFLAPDLGQSMGLTDVEVYALLRAAGALSHGLAARNYAIVQLMLQAGRLWCKLSNSIVNADFRSENGVLAY